MVQGLTPNYSIGERGSSGRAFKVYAPHILSWRLGCIIISEHKEVHKNSITDTFNPFRDIMHGGTLLRIPGSDRNIWIADSVLIIGNIFKRLVIKYGRD